MKNLMLAFTMLLVSCVCMAASIEGYSPNYKQQQAFFIKYGSEAKVYWKYISANLCSADFIPDSSCQYAERAFYNMDGEYLGSTQMIELKHMPIRLHNKIKKLLTNCTICEVIEYWCEDGWHYYFVKFNSREGQKIAKISIDGNVELVDYRM